jgi:hypothetical protein
MSPFFGTKHHDRSSPTKKSSIHLSLPAMDHSIELSPIEAVEAVENADNADNVTRLLPTSGSHPIVPNHN